MKACQSGFNICTWSASSNLEIDRYKDTNKPIFEHKWRHITVNPLYLYLVSLQMVWYYFKCEKWNPDFNKSMFRHAWRHIKVRVVPLYLYLAGLQEPPCGQIVFWCKNCNPPTNKPIFRNTLRHIRGWPLYLYLTNLQDQLPAASN